MKLPRVRVQTLPAYTAAEAPATPSGRVTPTIRSIEVGYAEIDRPTIYRAMVDALIYNLTFIQDSGMPFDQSRLESLNMMHNAGRCLWSWSSIPSPYLEDGIEQLKRHTLRSSNLFPLDMQVLSPRFACLLLLTNFSKIERDLHRVAEAQGLVIKSKVNLAFATSCLDYGSPALRPYARLEPLQERAGYNDAQSAILALADSGSLPFSHYQLVRGTYEADQAKRITGARGAVMLDLAVLSKELDKVPDAAELGEELMNVSSSVYAKAADLVMTGEWNQLSLGHVPGDPDDDILVLTARAIIRRIGCEGRDQLIDPVALLCLSLLTGISPACFMRHALADFQRRGTTYISMAGAVELAELVSRIEVLAGREEARKVVLVRELDQLADRLSAAHTGKKDWEVELPQKMLKAWSPAGLAWEWTKPVAEEDAA
jgi:hypothetical protein